MHDPRMRHPPPCAHLILLVRLPVCDSPGELCGPEPVVEQGLALFVQEEVLLAVDADEEDALAGVDPEAAEAANGRLEHHPSGLRARVRKGGGVSRLLRSEAHKSESLRE